MTTTSTAAALQSAEQVMARAGKTFHQAARLLPAGVRAEVVQLYAFCRRVDDLADDAAVPVAARRVALGGILEALESADLRALAASGWALGAAPRRLGAAAMLVRAARLDLDQIQPATADDVLLYAFGVAGTVGLLMADVLGADGRGLPAAVALGCAMQCSNICRDVAEDAREGRVYLPAEAVEAGRLLPALAGADPAAAECVERATLALLRRADTLYQAACDGMWSLPVRVRWSILVAAMCYREIGVEVGKDVRRSWQVRTVVSRGRKLQLVLLATLRLLHPRFWWPRARAGRPPQLTEAVAHRMRQLGVSA